VVGVLATVVDGAAGKPLPELVDQAGRHRVILAKHCPDDFVDRILMRTEVHLAVDRQTVHGVKARFDSSRQFLRKLESIYTEDCAFSVTMAFRRGDLSVKGRCRVSK
jgi:hypothetical protein